MKLAGPPWRKHDHQLNRAEGKQGKHGDAGILPKAKEAIANGEGESSEKRVHATRRQTVQDKSRSESGRGQTRQTRRCGHPPEGEGGHSQWRRREFRKTCTRNAPPDRAR